MEYCEVGNTGVRVSRLCFGTVGISKDKFERCLDAGINFIDTADVYDDGEAELLLGALMKGRRDELVVSSKTGFPTSEDSDSGGLSRRCIMRAIEGSLKRLQTDRIDFYFLHCYDPNTDMEETLHAMDDLVHAGKIRYLAVSNWAAWQIAKAIGISRSAGLAAFACVEPMYSLIKRQAEVEILPLALAENLGVVPYSPIAGGLLTGKYSGPEQATEGRLSHDALSQKRYGEKRYFEVAARFVKHAESRGVNPAALALAWVMSHPAVTAPIFGARSVRHIDTALSALDIAMTPEWRAEVSALSIEPPNATDRLEEKRGFFYRGWRPESKPVESPGN